LAIATESAYPIVFATNNTLRATLDSSGNLGLGVGTTTPAAKLHVKSGYGEIARFYDTSDNGISITANASTGFNQITSTGNQPLLFSVNSAERFRIHPEGQILVAANGSASLPIISRSSDTNTGLYFPAADTLALAVGGSDAVYIDSGRRVGMGIVPDASARLHIASSGVNVYGLVSHNNGTLASANTSQIWLANGTTFVGASDRSYRIYNEGTSGTASDLIFGYWNGSSAPERLRIKSGGQINFTGLASDPTGAAGDLYYSSASNVFKYHDGTAWARLPRKYSAALSGDPGTVFTVTHNFNTREVTVQVRKTNSPFDIVYTDVKLTNLNTVTVEFAASVTPADYTVTIIG
jgi:hypothetical protein